MTMKKNKHFLIMIICCALAMLVIVMLSRYFNVGSFAFLLILLFPLAYIILMKLFMKKAKTPALKMIVVIKK
jgi:Zn-dependent protease with chaperone function